MSATADPDEIRRAIELLVKLGDVHELRVLEAGRDGTVSGYFNDLNKLATAAAHWSGRAPAIYLTLNPTVHTLLARAVNRVQKHAKTSTQDTDILKRLWLLIDCDPTRPKGISSTEEEHAAALTRTRAIRDWLTSQSWPAPVLADSGNGGHLLYQIDLPNDDAAKALIERCLKALASRFDDAAAKIDQTVFNASRVSKVYGTLAAKGDSTPDRPHRIARILELPEVINVVSAELLQVLAASAPQAKRKTPKSQARPSNSGTQSSSFSELNQAALANLSAWVPALFPKARPYHDGYRVSSRDLGRDLEEDLSLLPAGIRDFGQEDGLTPIDTVMRFNGCSTPKEAAQWLATQLGVEFPTNGKKR
jgi:hypothetical protein